MAGAGAPHPIDWFALVSGCVGGISLLSYSLAKVSHALRAALGPGLRTAVKAATATRLLGFVTGVLVTAALTSATASSLLVLAFVQAGDMTLAQSLGIGLGINVGATVSAHLMVFSLQRYSMALVAAGYSLGSWCGPGTALGRTGEALLGLGLLFKATAIVSGAIAPLRAHEPFVRALQGVAGNPALAMAVAAAAAVACLSSNSVIAVVITMAQQGISRTPQLKSRLRLSWRSRHSTQSTTRPRRCTIASSFRSLTATHGMNSATVAALAALAAVARLPPAAAQSAAFTSAPQMVYDWVRDHCPRYPTMPLRSCVPDIKEGCDPDVVDACPRVWANSPNSFRGLGSVDGVSRAQVGPSLDALAHSCGPAYQNATYDPDLAHFRNHEWIEAPVAFPANGTVYALAHVDLLNGTSQTSHPNNYLYTALTLFASTDGGASFAPARPPPGHLVATSPYDNSNGTLGAGVGFGMPSSVLYVPSTGFYYVLLLAGWGLPVGAQAGGLCLARSRDITDPASWRAWNGSEAGFASTLNASPLLAPVLDPTAHVCQPLRDATGALLSLRHTSLLWSSFYQRFLLFGEAGAGGALNGTGWAFALSDDLLTWTAPVAVDPAGYIDPAGNATIGPQVSPLPGRFVRTPDPGLGSWWEAPGGAYKAPVGSCAPCPGLDACSPNTTVTIPVAQWAALPNATFPFSCSLVYSPRGYINYVYSVVVDDSANAASGGGDPSLNTVGQDAHIFLVAKKCAGVTWSAAGGLACTPLDATQRDQRDVVRATLRFS